MSDYLTLQNIVMVGGALALLILILAWVMVMNGQNDLDWSQLISTKGADGKQYADWNRIGMGAGVVVSVWLPAVYAYSPDMEATGLAAVLAVVLAYLGGVSGYAATLRARQGTVTTTTEPVPPSEGEKKTIVETPPVKPKGKK